jgi:hypothetical protein
MSFSYNRKTISLALPFFAQYNIAIQIRHTIKVLHD